jgi:hypothetical protein
VSLGNLFRVIQLSTLVLCCPLLFLHVKSFELKKFIDTVPNLLHQSIPVKTDDVVFWEITKGACKFLFWPMGDQTRGLRFPYDERAIDFEPTVHQTQPCCLPQPPADAITDTRALVCRQIDDCVYIQLFKTGLMTELCATVERVHFIFERH